MKLAIHTAMLLGAVGVCLSAFIQIFQQMWLGTPGAIVMLPTIPAFFVAFLKDEFSHDVSARLRWLVVAYAIVVVVGALTQWPAIVEEWTNLVLWLGVPALFLAMWTMRAWRTRSTIRSL